MFAKLSFTGLVYIPVTLAFVFLSYFYFKDWRDRRTALSKQLFFLFVLITLICLTGALSGTVYVNSKQGITLMLIISSFLVALANALLGYMFVNEQFPRTSPWLGFTPIFVFGLFVSLLTIQSEIQPAVEETGGVDWGLPKNIDLLRSLIYFMGFLPASWLFINKYRQFTDYSRKREYLFLSIVSVFTIGIVLVDFVIEPTISAPALWSELAILILSVFALILYFLLNERTLRASESRLKLVVDAAQLGLWDYNLLTGKITINETWQRHSGISLDRNFTSVTEIINNLHPDDRAMYESELKKHLEGKNTMFHLECRTLHKPDAYKWVQDTGKVMVKDAQNKPERMLGIRTIIQEKKDYEHKLQKALKKADESNKLKSAFLTLLSHEIRTPMNGIMGFADLLADPNFEQDEKGVFLRNIQESGNRMQKTITDIVTMAKIQSEELVVSKQKIKPLKILNELIEQWSPAAAEKEISIQLEYPKQIDHYIIESDEEKLRIVFDNLLNNAIKYTPEGSIKVIYAENPGELQFTFKDSGIGIPPENRESVFKEFTQVHQDLSKPFEGLGLGLSICKALVEAIGGRIYIDENYNEGSSFVVSLPVR